VKTPPTLIFSGMIAGDPHQGGASWAVLQYLLGFQRLGWRVCFIEPISRTKLKPAGTSLAESDNARYFKSVMSDFGLASCSSLLLVESWETVGIKYELLSSITANAQVLINISGMLADPALFLPPPIRVYLDLDPAFVQIWNAQGIDMRFKHHTHFVTVGQAIGSPGCFVPTGDKQWLHTWPPVVLDHWPVATAAPSLGLTTVGNWRAYGSVSYRGKTLGQKVHSIRHVMDLPSKLKEPITVAMAIDPAEAMDLRTLQASGWKLIDPLSVAGTPHNYQAFLSNSKAEIGITKHGYVASACGWFSDRSVCYLATGRPVIAQDTGWSRFLPTGEGLFAFSSLDDAVNAVDTINRSEAPHGLAARRIAREFFDSDKVLRRLLAMIGAAS
jgi:hypothetical protein